MVGEGLDEEDMITQLLDVEKHPCRPAYQVASDMPLNLYSARYEGVEWRCDKTSAEFSLRSTQKLWTEFVVKAASGQGGTQRA